LSYEYYLEQSDSEEYLFSSLQDKLPLSSTVQSSNDKGTMQVENIFRTIATFFSSCSLLKGSSNGCRSAARSVQDKMSRRPPSTICFVFPDGDLLALGRRKAASIFHIFLVTKLWQMGKYFLLVGCPPCSQ